MKKLSRLGLVAAASVAVLALGACSSTTADDAGEESKGAIAMGFASSDITIWNDQLEIMQPIIEEAGYEFLTSDPQFDIQRQVADWEAWVNRGDVKAIMGYPVSTDSMIPVTASATAAGIPVLGYLLSWEGIAAATVVDSYDGGYELGALTGESLVEEYGDDVDVTVAILGNRETDFTALAMDGLIEGVQSVAPDVKIAELTASTREEGYNVTQSQLIADPETKVWLGVSNDPMHGTYQALLDYGVAADDSEYFVASRDATNETLDLIKIPNSIYRTSIVVSSQALAEANAKLLIDAAEGKTVETVTVPGVFVTADNADEYYVD